MKKIKVLYVEDEPFLARVVKDSLESRNFDVHMIYDGAIASEAFDVFNPDICILDIMLPNKDGFSILKEIRIKNPHIPVIFLTAKTHTNDLVAGFEHGGNDYLKKPFSMEELIVRMQNLLHLAGRNSGNNSVPAEEKIITIGSYVFYPERFELHHKKNIRKLSRRETLLLELLTNDMGATVLRKDILMKIWSDDSFYNSRSLDVYISKIRDYLSHDPSIHIITLKGTGYRIVLDNA